MHVLIILAFIGTEKLIVDRLYDNNNNKVFIFRGYNIKLTLI